MQRLSSIKVSANIKVIMQLPDPVMGLNLMGLNLLYRGECDANKTIFWVDGVMGSIACALSGVGVERKPGRIFLTEALKFISKNYPDRPVIFMNDGKPLSEITCLLGRRPSQIKLPWHEVKRDFETLSFAGVNSRCFVFIAIGSPKQEWLAQLIYTKTKAKCFCIGGAVNMLEKRENPAPRWVERCGLEWVYRLQNEPWRRAKRLVNSLYYGVRGLILSKRLTCVKIECPKSSPSDLTVHSREPE